MSNLSALILIYVITILIVSYFIGNINPAIIISRKIKSIDIRTVNSKNAGASNTLMTFGFKWALVVAFVDVFKGFIVVFTLKSLYPESNILHVLAGLSVIIGHIYPIIFRFKGGKGTATFFGLILGINVWVGTILILIFAMALFMFKYVTISTFIVVILAPIYMYSADFEWIAVFLMSGFAILSFFKHRSNIKHMFEGSETSVYDVMNK